MSSQTILTTNHDLRNWVDEHMGGDVTDADVEAVTAAIQALAHPPWGDDWSEFLAPLDLFALMPE